MSTFKEQMTQPVVQKQTVASQIFVRVVSGVITVFVIMAIMAILGVD